jgi:hypothetical protein
MLPSKRIKPKMSRTFFILLATLSIVDSSLSQDFNRINIPVIINDRQLAFPFTGGLKTGQFSNIDFNGDGLNDLFVFDRNGDQILPFIKTAGKGNLSYEFAPQYISDFPVLRNWAFIRDYNKDGIPDIFTSSNVLPGCAEVWKGGKDANGKLRFNRLRFNYGFPDILQIPVSSGYAQIYVSNIDLPSIEDVDGDGDLDILSFEPDGGFASFYQNVNIEEGLPADSLKYIRKDICWGKFAENQFNDNITLSDNPFICASGLTDGGNTGVRHSGSSVTWIDMDGDNDMDLLIGDIASSYMKLLINGGSRDQAYIKALVDKFPDESAPAFLDVFLAAYYLDVDADGRRDLIITPNDVNNQESENHIWLYLNEGTDEKPVFRLEKKNFLVDEMLDVSSGSHPTFADVNGDGLLDIVTGTNGIFGKGGSKQNRMVLFLNTGTLQEPRFTLTEPDFLGFSRFGNDTGRLAPAFGDLDVDGDADLLVGDSFGQLFYLENKSGPDMPMVFSDPIYPYMDIFIGQNAKPQIIDMDGDGKNDIVCGEKNNELNFFKNTGSTGTAFFGFDQTKLPNTNQMGKIFSSNDFFTQNGAPCIVQSGDKKIMLLGTESADILAFDNLEGKVYGSFNRFSDRIGNIRQGRKVTPAMADIDNDGFFELAVGNERGGLAFYNTNFRKDSSSSVTNHAKLADIIVYPNPSNESLYIGGGDDSWRFRLLTPDGTGSFLLKSGENILPTNIVQGMYILEVSSGKQTFQKKIMIVQP